jgi:sulfopyruvate decarboxylase alpha subunit
MAETEDWPQLIYTALKDANVSQAYYVPDAGHARLIRMLGDDPAVRSMPLTTEEEGIALAAGAWLGGARSVILMQSSGVGNCINMLSLANNCKFPLLMFVTMRGEWAEFNPWQIPMGSATEGSLKLMGLHTIRVDTVEELKFALESSISMSFDSDVAVAVLLSQRFLGRKKWVK